MTPLERAHLSLSGLSVGDALGEALPHPKLAAASYVNDENLPSPPWRYTDDTEMALSIVEILTEHGKIDSDALAAAFARRFNPMRGYGGGARGLLMQLHVGFDWRIQSQQMFGGSGSYGNGGSMRAAPIGAYFADDLEAVKENAIASAIPTHQHPEGISGAVAVAIAAALAWRIGNGQAMTPQAFLETIISHLPQDRVRTGIEKAATLEFGKHPPFLAATKLGSGQLISAADTVPFTLWCAAYFMGSYRQAFWATASGMGDRDTNCAIVGGIVALSDRRDGIPSEWLNAREELPPL